VEKDVPPHKLRPLPRTLLTIPKRRDMLGKVWYFDGAPDLPAGRWKVRRMEGDTYVCTRMTGGGLCNLEKFDIGYVIHQVTLERDRLCEMGPLGPRGRRTR